MMMMMMMMTMMTTTIMMMMMMMIKHRFRNILVRPRTGHEGCTQST